MSFYNPGELFQNWRDNDYGILPIPPPVLSELEALPLSHSGCYTSIFLGHIDHSGAETMKAVALAVSARRLGNCFGFAQFVLGRLAVSSGD